MACWLWMRVVEIGITLTRLDFGCLMINCFFAAACCGTRGFECGHSAPEENRTVSFAGATAGGTEYARQIIESVLAQSDHEELTVLALELLDQPAAAKPKASAAPAPKPAADKINDKYIGRLR
jgi:hypothetical protein